MKKTLSLCLAAAILCCTSITTTVHASTSKSTTSTQIEKSTKSNDNIISVGDKTKIKLGEVYVTVPYEKEDISVKYNKTSKEIEAKIIDKNTKDVLTTIGEEISSNKSNVNTLLAASSAGSYYDKTVYADVKAGPTTSRLYGVLSCYSYDSFRQINSVKNTYWKPMTSGSWTLEDKSSSGYVVSSSTGKPGTKAVIYGDANVVVTTTTSTTGSFSITALETAGFEVTNSSGSTYYARNPIDKEFTYSLY